MLKHKKNSLAQENQVSNNLADGIKNMFTAKNANSQDKKYKFLKQTEELKTKSTYNNEILSAESNLEEFEAMEARKKSQEHKLRAQNYISKIFKAINTKNIGLMDDILKRYQGDLNMIFDCDSNSLIGLAAMHGDFRMIQILLAKGVNANSQNNLGNTPLHYAIMKKYNKCIDTLITYGVDENIENY